MRKICACISLHAHLPQFWPNKQIPASVVLLSNTSYLQKSGKKPDTLTHTLAVFHRIRFQSPNESVMADCS